MANHRLRPATADDREFLCRVYAATREEELAAVPWSTEQKAAFARAQFEAQDRHYRTHYPGAEFLVIEAAGVPAGRLYLHRSEKELRIVDISLMPGARGTGTGTAILRALLDESERDGRCVTIHVERMNRALRLYERLGFKPVEDKGVYLFMRRDAPAGGVR